MIEGQQKGDKYVPSSSTEHARSRPFWPPAVPQAEIRQSSTHSRVFCGISPSVVIPDQPRLSACRRQLPWAMPKPAAAAALLACLVWLCSPSVCTVSETELWGSRGGLQAGVSPLDFHRPRRRPRQLLVPPLCPPAAAPGGLCSHSLLPLAWNSHFRLYAAPTHCSRLQRHAGPPCHHCHRRFPRRYRGQSFQQGRQWCRRWCSSHSCAHPTTPQPQPGCCSSGDGGQRSSGPQATRELPPRQAQVRTPAAQYKVPPGRPDARPLCGSASR